MALLGSTISTNRTIDLGFGKHSHMIDPRNISEMFLIGKISVTLTVCSQAWSKTSFAITLLMISDGFHGRTRIFIWFAVVSMNLFFGTAAMLFWVGCSPVEKAWNLFVPGKCWSQYVPVLFMIFTSGEFVGAAVRDGADQNSILGHHGLDIRHHPVEDHYEDADGN